MNSTTPTGIPITYCDDCERIHPATRGHCIACGYASMFIDPDGICINCYKKATHGTQPE